MRYQFIFLMFLCFSIQTDAYQDNPGQKNDKKDFQIFLSQPAKSIKLLMYEKDFTPIQGKLSDDKKSIIIKDYKSGSKVRVKVEYEDGSIDEFVRSPCFIDPVVKVSMSDMPLNSFALIGR